MEFLANIGGPDAIIGRGIIITIIDTDVVTSRAVAYSTVAPISGEIIGCCILAQDVPLAATTPPATEVW